MSAENRPVTQILVPLDFSECSLSAFDYAKRIAAGGRSRLHLLYVDDDAILMQPSTHPSFHEPHDRKMLQRLVDLLTPEEKEYLPAVMEVRVGTAYHEIEEYAAGFDAEHPKLASALRQISVALGNVGI